MKTTNSVAASGHTSPDVITQQQLRRLAKKHDAFNKSCVEIAERLAIGAEVEGGAFKASVCDNPFTANEYTSSHGFVNCGLSLDCNPEGSGELSVAEDAPEKSASELADIRAQAVRLHVLVDQLAEEVIQEALAS